MVEDEMNFIFAVFFTILIVGLVALFTIDINSNKGEVEPPVEKPLVEEAK